METTVKIWKLEEIKKLLEVSDKFVCRSVVKIFERQTEDEQQADQTGHNNGIGFNGIDAFILSRFAKFYMERKFLSPKQMIIARKKIMKYAKQLTSIANEPKQPATEPSEPITEQLKLVLVGEVNAGKIYKVANRYTIDNDEIPDEIIQQQIDELRGK